MFEERVPRRLFGPKMQRYRENYKTRTLRSCTAHQMIKSRRMTWAGHVAPMGETSGTFGGLMGKPEGKKPLGRPRRRWENNINIYLRDVSWFGLFWLGLVTGSRFFLMR